MRRAIDIAVSSGLLILLCPLLIALAVLVKCDSPGPVLFRQQRAGRNQQPFWMLKFRSMHDGAERLRPDLEPGQVHSPVFKLPNDPRLTPVGRVLRRLSMDELPQLLNVLRGEMALVGPRPLPVSDLRRFEQSWRTGEVTDESIPLWHSRRALVRPGLTGLWQVSARNRLDVGTWVRYDCQYVRERSLRTDLCLLLRTAPAVLKRNGAR